MPPFCHFARVAMFRVPHMRRRRHTALSHANSTPCLDIHSRQASTVDWQQDSARTPGCNPSTPTHEGRGNRPISSPQAFSTAENTTTNGGPHKGWPQAGRVCNAVQIANVAWFNTAQFVFIICRLHCQHAESRPPIRCSSAQPSNTRVKYSSRYD